MAGGVLTGVEPADFVNLVRRRFGIRVRDEALYITALTHTSYVNENPGQGLVSNQRLEFLGDAVLDLVVAHEVFARGPGLAEGELTRARAAVVCETALGAAASRIGLGGYLRLGKGEEGTGGRERPSTLSDALEAVIGAAFVDSGLGGARRLILGLLGREIGSALNGHPLVDYKTLLHETAQRLSPPACALAYHVEAETGPDHDKTFVVAVRLGEKPLGKGSGKSKKDAEQEAARDALSKLGR